MASGRAFAAHVALQLPLQSKQTLEQALGELGVGVEFISARSIAPSLPACHFLLLGRPPRLDWSAAQRLRLLQVAGVGVDPLFPAVGLSGQVFIAKTRCGQERAVRDHVLAQVFSFARGLPAAWAAQRERKWRRYPSSPVDDQRLVVVGLGAIGSLVATAGRALGFQVLAVCRSPRAHPAVERVVGRDELPDVVSDADYVVVCLPLSDATRGLFDKRLLARLPEQSVLINVSRGGIVDEAALEAALRAGRLRGAALDVFEAEPLPADSSLWHCPGLSITPHVAGFTPDYLERVVEVFAHNVECVLRGQEPADLVSRALGY